MIGYSLQLLMHKLKSNYIKLDTKTRLYNSAQPIIGLTGGIATGKSTASKILSSLGVPVIDADKLIKKVYAKDSIFKFLEQNCPQVINSKQINFKLLREIFFNDKKLKQQLELLLYQYLPEAFEEAKKELSFSKYNFLIYDVPLLFEKKLEEKCDLTVLISCSADQQMQRLIKRDHLSIELAKKILAHQMPLEEKEKKANFVIENTSAPQKLHSKMIKFLETLTQGS